MGGYMALTGREDSVKREFDIIFGDVCKALGKVDMTAPLNGADRYFNADTMFSNYDNFFLVEFKSHYDSVKRENHKESACDLCCGLDKDKHMIPPHDLCHFIAYGTEENGKMVVEWDIYKNRVCNSQTLPKCAGAASINGAPVNGVASDLVEDVLASIKGLGPNDFKRYLDWLLGDRGLSKKRKSAVKKNGDFKAKIYASSSNYVIESPFFESLNDIIRWASKIPVKKDDYKPRNRKP